jgi:hypothetical protein
LKIPYFKSAVAFLFLFFLHGTSIGNGQQGISYNVLQISEGTNSVGIVRLNLGFCLSAVITSAFD